MHMYVHMCTQCTVHVYAHVHMWGEWRSIELQGFGRDQPPLVRERTQPSLVMMMTIMTMLIMLMLIMLMLTMTRLIMMTS